jgi:hypothetical protein
MYRLAVGLTMILLAGLPAVEAQQSAKVPRIGYLATRSLASPETQVLVDAFRQGLRERGYVEGESILIEYRSAEGKIERFPGLATELTRLKVRAGHQPQDREGDWPHDPAVGAAAGG